jgi:hypothetical protein
MEPSISPAKLDNDLGWLRFWRHSTFVTMNNFESAASRLRLAAQVQFTALIRMQAFELTGIDLLEASPFLTTTPRSIEDEMM